MTHRLKRLERFYGARTMTWGAMLSLIDTVTDACALHLEPATLAPLTAEIDEIVAMALRGEWERLQQWGNRNEA